MKQICSSLISLHLYRASDSSQAGSVSMGVGHPERHSLYHPDASVFIPPFLNANSLIAISPALRAGIDQCMHKPQYVRSFGTWQLYLLNNFFTLSETSLTSRQCPCCCLLFINSYSISLPYDFNLSWKSASACSIVLRYHFKASS